ncbi:MAG: acyl-CoA synthetase FdrA [Thermomicrobium sp.]|nr:acyl-CoA synthetase FdrA [Thermomicrobium sp.]MDW8007523.1 acyl-CoA synthetase FdrA [Thermomicrobium sp.]
MIVRVHVEPNAYFDSVALMAVAAATNRRAGVDLAALVMGTSANLELLRDSGIWDDQLTEVGPNDLVVAVRAQDEETAIAAIQFALDELRRAAPVRQAAETSLVPRTLRGALRLAPQARIVAVSVPGPYAPIEAEEALRSGRHVFLFSDNVPIDEEVRLKRLASELGLLLMGPDCGTASIAGLGLGFMNAVRRGPIGIVAAAGTGLQQVASLVDWFGSGINHGIGTGGRDLDERVGGLTMTAGLAALASDPTTEVIVLISKPPAPAVAQRVLERAAHCGKPVVACFVGGTAEEYAGIQVARDLTEAARRAVHLATGQPLATLDVPGLAEARARLDAERPKLAPEQRFLRGLYSGGTLCDEAMTLLMPKIGAIHSNIPLRPDLRLADPHRSAGHTFVDLGSDEFTVGRPHPMIDQTIRIERLRREAQDPTVAAIVLDVVLGYGATPDPAAELAPAIAEARERARQAGRLLPVIVALVGTRADPQGFDRQRERLEAAGAIVVPSNAAAAELAAQLVA